MPFCFFMTMLWLNACAGEVIHVMKYTADHFGFDIVLLAVTLICIGNSLSDYFTETSLASRGFGIMAVTGAVACQFFNLVIGWGLNTFMLVYSSKTGHIDFRLFDFEDVNEENSTPSYALLIISFCIVNLIMMMVLPRFRDRVLTKNFAIYLLCAYLFFLMLIGYFCYLLTRGFG